MKRDLRTSLPCLVTVVLALAAASVAVAQDSIEKVLRDLNRSASVAEREEIKSYTTIFTAYLALPAPPMEIGDRFNLNTIHPGMDEWSAVAGWTESNPGMAQAILAVEEKTLFGLPYGPEGVQSEFREADLVAEIGVGGSLRRSRFPYLDAIDTIAAYATAESYRLLEAGRIEEGLDLMVAAVFLLRQCCDREFLAEQLHSITLLTQALVNLRDMFHLYRDEVNPDQFAEIAILKLPFLRPDRSRLLLPEGDRRVSEALIKEVFDDQGQADREKFPATFAAIQSKNAPLTRFGAARRWRMIADVHDSEEISQQRLKLVYDDWWRRWRVEAYDPILDLPTQFELTNPVRYAAVIYSMQNIEQLFDVRNMLVASVNGTAMASGLCGYHRRHGTYPSQTDATYATFSRKRSDTDPYDVEFGRFKYRVLGSSFAVDTPEGRLRLEAGECILYSKGQDHEDDRGEEHRLDGSSGDIVIWPPVRAMSREQGLMD